MMPTPTPDDDRIIRAAASRRMSNPAPYDGATFKVLTMLEIKADSLDDAIDRTETLLAELVTGKPTDASDLWVRAGWIVR